LPKSQHEIFRIAWWSSNLLLAIALLSSLYFGWRECSLRWYLDGFSDAIVPSVMPAEPKVQAILNWMRIEPSRAIAMDPAALAARDPYMTLNYKQLLNVCGTATNAFLNLAREDNLQVRRLLLLTPEGNTKHVVAEVLMDGRWIVVDPTYRLIMRDASGRMLTRTDLRNSELLAQATSAIPSYPPSYTYERVAHVRMARLPLQGLGLGRLLDAVYPSWGEAFDWSLVLERQSFFCLVVTGAAALFFLLLRTLLAGYADRRLRMPRFHLREHAIRAGSAFLATPEIKE
jgi:transglutaminase superfamily protein